MIEVFLQLHSNRFCVMGLFYVNIHMFIHIVHILKISTRLKKLEDWHITLHLNEVSHDESVRHHNAQIHDTKQ